MRILKLRNLIVFVVDFSFLIKCIAIDRDLVTSNSSHNTRFFLEDWIINL